MILVEKNGTGRRTLSQNVLAATATSVDSLVIIVGAVVVLFVATLSVWVRRSGEFPNIAVKIITIARNKIKIMLLGSCRHKKFQSVFVVKFHGVHGTDIHRFRTISTYHRLVIVLRMQLVVLLLLLLLSILPHHQHQTLHSVLHHLLLAERNIRIQRIIIIITITISKKILLPLWALLIDHFRNKN